MVFEPSDQFSDVVEHLVVEVQACASDFDQLLNWLLITIHVNQKEVLRELGTTSEKVMNQ